MAYTLRDDLHWCDCGGRAVFLDTQADLYFCLPQAANSAFLQLAAGNVRPADIERLDPLLARGMLIEAGADAAIKAPPGPDLATHDWLDAPGPGAGLLLILRALASEARAAFELRTKSLQQVIDAARRAGREGAPVGPDIVRSGRDIAAASAAASFITRSHDRCLVRALAAYSLCRTIGCNAALVFGVIAHPFSAHAWVQLDGGVLVGGYEQARLYTPILVLE